MKALRHLLYIFITGILTLNSLSCDRMDDNGPFEGYWHLVDCEGETAVLDPKSDITWGVRNELIQMQDLRTGAIYYFCTFKRTKHLLELLEVFENDGTNDTKIDFSKIPEKYHVPADGRFEIVTLNGHELMLRSPQGTLRFKKN